MPKSRSKSKSKSSSKMKQRKLRGGYVSPSFKWVKKMKNGSEADQEFWVLTEERHFSEKQLEAYMKLKDKYKLHPLISAKVESETEVDLTEITSINQYNENEIYLEARRQDGYPKGVSIFRSEDAMNEKAVEEMDLRLQDALTYAFDNPESLDEYAEIGETDIRNFASNFSAADVEDRSKGDLLNMAADEDIEDADMLSMAKLEEKVQAARYDHHEDQLRVRPLVHLTDVTATYRMDDSDLWNYVDIDTKRMAMEEVERSGAAEIIGEGGNWEEVQDPDSSDWYQIVW